MGGAASFSYWTADEQEANERAERLMLSAKDFILDYMYHGIPVRSGKKSWDPSSPLHFEVDPKVLQDAMYGTGEVEKTLLEGVPSTVIVNKKGLVRINFIMDTHVEHELTVKDINDAIVVDETFGNFYVPMPQPPRLLKAEKTRMHIIWELPQPPGISQKCEVQYCFVHPKLMSRVEEYLAKLETVKQEIVDSGALMRDKDKDVYRTMDTDEDPYGLGICPLQFSSLSSRTYNKPNFLSFSFSEKELKPGDALVFRIRFMNHRGWSNFSFPSEILLTLPDKPSAPRQPISTFVTSRSAQLFWVPPERDNGAAITRYILKGKSTGGDYVKLYQGKNSNFLATDLHPEFAYSFIVAAINKVGASEFSQPMTLTTPKDADKPRPRDPDSFEWNMATQFRDAWRELWDPATERVFYFNIITGVRQLEMPDALKNDVGGGAEGEGGEDGEVSRVESDAEKAHRLEIDFRKKRYRLIRSVHTNAARMPNGPGSTEQFKKVKLNRSSILADAFKKMAKCPPQDLKKRIKFEFEGEDAIDSGGVGKEAFLLISKTMIRYCGVSHRGILRVTDKETGGIFFANRDDSPSNGGMKGEEEVHPSRRIDDRTKAEMGAVTTPVLCRFLGRLLAKALYDRQLVDAPLSPLLLKHILGLTRDDEELDQQERERDMGGKRVPAIAVAGASGVGKERQGDGRRSVEGSPSPPKARGRGEDMESRSSPGKRVGETKSKYLVSSQPDDAEEEEKEKRARVGEEEGDENPKSRPTSELLLEVKDLDQDLYRSLSWMMDNDITDIVYEKFCVVSRVLKKKKGESKDKDAKGASKSAMAAAMPGEKGGGDGSPLSPSAADYEYKEIPLCANGQKMDVTNENKEQYVRLLVRWKTRYAIAALLDPFLQGFYELIPHRLVRECDLSPEELSQMLNGKPRVDVDDLRAYCIYQGGSGKKKKMAPAAAAATTATAERGGRDTDQDRLEVTGGEDETEGDTDDEKDEKGEKGEEGRQEEAEEDEMEFGDSHERVVWFWQTLRDMSEEDSRGVLSFFTGSTCVPVDGYEPPLNITEGVDMDTDALPRAHTCFNQIVLPPYSSAAKMKERLLFASRESQGFQFG